MEPFCPDCGYDVRTQFVHGIDIQCPECGKRFRSDDLCFSRIPWLHRAEIGRFRAFVRTMNLATFGPSLLATTPNNDPAAAISFRRLCTLGLCLAIPIAYWSILSAAGLDPAKWGSSLGRSAPAQYAYPWILSAQRPWLAVPMLAGLGLSLAILPTRLIGFAQYPAASRAALLRSSQYLVAAFYEGALYGLGIVLILMSIGLLMVRPHAAMSAIPSQLAVCIPAAALILWLNACHRFLWRASARATRRALWPAVLLLPALLLITLWWLAILPFCSGLIYAAIRSWLS